MIIYRTTNLITGKIYIGQKPTMETEEQLLKSTYYGSSKQLKADVKEFGKENFKREVLEVGIQSKEELNEKKHGICYWMLQILK